MHMLVIGASGCTGRLVVDDAVSRGHTITALVRNPSSLPTTQGLHIIQGTPTKLEDVEKALSNNINGTPQAVIVTLNAPRASDSPFAKPIVPPRFMADCISNIRRAMTSHNIKKLVVMSAFGVGESFKSLNFTTKGVIKHTNMAVQFEDHNMVYQETKDDEVDWVFASPAMLNDGESLPIKEYGSAGEGTCFMPSISRKSVAKFLLDAAESDKWNRTATVICN